MSGQEAFARAGADRDDPALALAEAERELAHRDALLHELIHRMRNTMQMVGSLIALQAAAIDDPPARQSFDDTAGRIRAIALALEHTARPGDLGAVDLGGYLRALLHAASGLDGRRNVAVSFQAEPAELAMARAVPLGIAINEILSNAFRHAFPPGRRGNLRLVARAQADGAIAVTIADDGVGLPPQIDPLRAATLGLRLVHRLARQADASLAVERTGGTVFRLVLAPEPRRGA
ncbi:MAG TPA: sensor histidine kinase [Hyphomicrobiales bacterium]|nr:sensor histidine kinase [Hyphomicrobiales bacterium]